MNLREKLEMLMSEKNITRAELAKQCGIPYTTIDGILKRNDFEKIKLSTLTKLKAFFDVTLDYLMDEGITDKNFGKYYDLQVNTKEQQIIEDYRLLTPAGKKTVDDTISNLIELEKSFRQATATATPNNVIDITSRQLPKYATPTSAGLGQYIDNSDYEMVTVGSECPIQTNFLLKVQGDSMEPKFHDGDMLYVKQQPNIEDGEIGIFYLDGNVYVKKVGHQDGKCYLISLNKDYSPIEINESSELICYGKVLN